MVCTKKNGTVKKYKLKIKKTPQVDNWSNAIQNSNLGNKTWWDIAYNGTKFVAISYNGYISTSTDGTTWSTPTYNSNLGSNDWYGITYGNDKFVAIGYLGYISTSTDGTTWTTRSQNLSSRNWRGITYGGTKFIAIGGTGYLSTSTDGVTWSTAVQNNNLGNNLWEHITYGNGKFIAIGSTGYTSTSTDGETWDTAIQNSDLGNNDWYCVSYDGTKFVSVSSNGYVSYSINGTDWSTAVQNNNLGNNSWRGLSYDGKKFVSISSTGYISTSIGIEKTYTLATKKEDVRNFVRPNLTSNGTLGGDSFAVSSNTGTAYYAVDGDDTNNITIPKSGELQYTLYNPYQLNVTKLVTYVYSGNYIEVNISASNDNLNWVQITHSDLWYGDRVEATLTNSQFYKYYKISITPTSSYISNYLIDIQITATEQYPKTTRYI